MDLLNHKNLDVRLAELERLVAETEKPVSTGDVNNHIHTFYSFSPYSPCKAVWMAYMSGLTTAGIMDHDSVSGCREFIKAGEITGVATTIGVECRADFSNTRLNGRRINNPDQKSIAYITLHAIPHENIEKVADYFKPYTIKRNIRNRKMVDKINELIPVRLSYEKDVVPVSKFFEGGSITERHILFALAKKLILGTDDIVDYAKTELGIEINGKIESYLRDKNNPHYYYDLLGVLKSVLIEKIYVDATDECPDVTELIAFAKEVGAIAAYAYLGDVGDSVTGDKKTQAFEDEYLDLLFEELYSLGFNAVTYMPTRNTLQQLMRIKELCTKYNFMEISGEDINSPRQLFVCEALKNPIFSNLIDSTWALIKHERGEKAI